MESGQHYAVRRFRDRKANANLERLNLQELMEYSALCGATLALSHARSGDPAFVAGYLGSGTNFDRAVAEFAAAYAQQAKRDYDAFVIADKGP